MTNTIARWLVGTVGSAVFSLSLLTVTAPETRAADLPRCVPAVTPGLFDPCADLDTSFVTDLR